jgi:hypothetical protein
MLRKPLAGLAVCALTIAGALAIGSPASADPPGEFTDGASFQEPDPCNPEVTMTTTLTFHVKVHNHRNVMVYVADFTAETDTGYVGSGRQTGVEGANHFADTQTAIVSNADGDRYKVNFHITGTPNGIAVDRFSIRCVGGR